MSLFLQCSVNLYVLNRIFYIACRVVYIRHFVYIHMIDMDMLHNIVSNPFIRFANK